MARVQLDKAPGELVDEILDEWPCVSVRSKKKEEAMRWCISELDILEPNWTLVGKNFWFKDPQVALHFKLVFG